MVSEKEPKSLEDLDFGLSPSGKAQDFDSCISLVRIQLAQLENLVSMEELHIYKVFVFSV